MTTRVVVLLSAPAGFLNVYFPTDGGARQFIKSWRDGHAERIKNGRFNDVQTMLLENTLPDDPQSISWAIMAQYVIGMYIPTKEQTAVDRMAAAAEKMAGHSCEGDEWKDQ